MRPRLFAALCLPLLLLAGCARKQTADLPGWLLRPDVPKGTDLEEVFRHNNLGAAHLEQHRYGEAAKEFERVVAMLPGWAEGHLNLGIASLNLHESLRAEQELNRALEISPGHPYAWYAIGLVHRQQGKTTAAMQAFEKVLQADPEDPDTHYNLGLLYAREGRHEPAIASLRKAIAGQPLNASARFRLASSLLALGRKEEGDREMEAFRELNESGAGVSLGLQYTEQGKYAFAVVDYRAFGPAAPASTRAALRFVPVPPAESGLSRAHGGGVPGDQLPEAAPPAARACFEAPGLAAADFDGDGDVDLLLPDCSRDGAPVPPALFRNDGAGRFTETGPETGLAPFAAGLGAAFGDYDNDGDPDLVLTGWGGIRLLNNRGKGSLADVTEDAGLAASGFAQGAAWADADHDGDLDLVVARWAGSPGLATPAPLLYFNNNGNGTFREVAAEKRVNRPLLARSVSFADLDDDRDVDFVVSTIDEGPVVFTNDRIGTFTPLGKEAGFTAYGKGETATLADLDGDGRVDLALPASGWYRNLGKLRFQARKAQDPAPPARGLAAFDADNDGDLDLVLAGERFLFLRNEGAARFADATGETGLAGLAPGATGGIVAADFDGDGDADLAISRAGEPVLLLRNDGGNLGRWIKVKLRGLHSNREGVGAKVEIHAGSSFQRREVRLGGGYLSQEPSTLLFGLGDRKLVDFVRLLWPGGVLQSELEVSAEQTLEISELDRKGSSCPILFTWAGRGWRFLTDFLGVGGIGFLVKPGVYGQPDPDEYVKIEASDLAPRDGYYLVQVLENLEEVTYLDEAKLLVVDHPADSEVFPHERFGGGGPPPFQLFSFRHPIPPISARDDGGRDVLGSLLKVDRTYPDRFPVLERLPGYAEPHTLTLDFGRAAVDRSNLVLFLHGWTDYGYSSTNLAASQAGIELIPPRLERMGDEGEWEILLEDMGFPAGMPRMMTVDLRDHGPFRDGRFRITTSMRIYWDRIFLAEVGASPEPRITRLSPAYADLHARGYPREHSPDGKQPLVYDYNLMDRTFPFRNLAGSYTRFGAVTELLEEADDRFVIFGRGEELTLKFKATGLPHLPRGWKRSFVLYTNGYCKDMDPNTAFPDTVEPLPFHAMTSYPYPEGEKYPDDPLHLEYLRKYNTRKVSGRP
jgi:tetratricopeptide (TPR) repeat protein